MKTARISGLGLAGLLLIATSQMYAQSAQLHIDDAGKVLAQHEHHHTKAGRTVSWVRHSGGNKPWSVTFSGDSPCKEGSTFGSNGPKTCTINVVCKAKGDPGCKTYAYNSSTGPGAAQNDPDIIVDP